MFFVSVHGFCSAGYEGCPLLISRPANTFTMSFGPGPVVYTLSQWTELNLSAIIRAPDAASVVGRIESLLSKDAVVTINGKASSGADFAGQLNQFKLPGTQASISFKEAVEVLASSQQPPVVRLFFLCIVSIKMNMNIITRPASLESFSPPPLNYPSSFTTFPPSRR